MERPGNASNLWQIQPLQLVTMRVARITNQVIYSENSIRKKLLKYNKYYTYKINRKKFSFCQKIEKK